MGVKVAVCRGVLLDVAEAARVGVLVGAGLIVLVGLDVAVLLGSGVDMDVAIGSGVVPRVHATMDMSKRSATMKIMHLLCSGLVC